MTQDVNSFLMGGGIQSAKFENIGDQTKGIVGDTELRQQTDINSNELLFWQDGNPRMQLVITLLTEDRDDDDDDGMRKVYAKGQMLQALRDAIRATGAKGIADGAKVAIKYTSNGEQQKRGFNPPKQYKVWYQAPPPPETVIEADSPFEDEAGDLDPDDIPF